MLATLGNALLMAGQSSGGTGQQGGSMLSLFVPMIVVFVVFYFMLIRPQQKQQKKVRAMLDTLKKGDLIVTRGGVHGRIAGLADTIVTLEICDNCKIKINRDQIAVIKEAATATE